MCGYSPTQSSRRYRVRCDTLPLTVSLCLSLYSLRRSVSTRVLECVRVRVRLCDGQGDFVSVHVWVRTFVEFPW